MLEQKILDEAPEGATHYCKGDYYREVFIDNGNGGQSQAFDFYWVEEDKWYNETVPHGIRSLNDIREIAELKAT
jgi:hypothetical protein